MTTPTSQMKSGSGATIPIASPISAPTTASTPSPATVPMTVPPTNQTSSSTTIQQTIPPNQPSVPTHPTRGSIGTADTTATITASASPSFTQPPTSTTTPTSKELPLPTTLDESRTVSQLEPSVSAETLPAPATTTASGVVPTSSIRGVPTGLKVLVNFRATGAAPIMKKTKFTLNASHRFGMIIEWLRKTLHFKPQDALFVYCSNAFAPNPDSSMYDLFQCYQIHGELVINYAIQDAWG